MGAGDSLSLQGAGSLLAQGLKGVGDSLSSRAKREAWVILSLFKGLVLGVEVEGGGGHGEALLVHGGELGWIRGGKGAYRLTEGMR
jgi:hypothetical protein